MAKLDKSAAYKSPFAHGYFQRGKGPPTEVWVEVPSYCLSTVRVNCCINWKNTGDSGLVSRLNTPQEHCWPHLRKDKHPVTVAWKSLHYQQQLQCLHFPGVAASREVCWC